MTVKADWSHDSPEVTEMLDVLGSRQIPVIAVFSAKDPEPSLGLPRQLHAGRDSPRPGEGRAVAGGGRLAGPFHKM